jgi:hypothetical protein
MEVWGTVIVGNANSATFTSTGSARVWYSCKAIEVAENVFAKSFREVGWHESD